METFFLFALIVVSVIIMVLAISKLKLHPFVVMVVIALLVGLAWGIDPVTVVNTVKSGFGNIMTSIGIVILCGTIIGTILERTGAALTMANFILKIVGKQRSVLAIGCMGYITGIPVFCDSGFVILSPISRALAEQSGTSLAVMATALSGGLYATHCLVPPTPGPIAMAGTLNADLGLTIIVGLILSIPGLIVTLLYASKISSKIDIPAKPLGTGAVYKAVMFIGNPVVALVLGVFLAMTLIPASEKKNALDWVSQGVTDSASILAITGAGGSFAAILALLPIADATQGLLQSGLGVIIPFAIAMILKLAMGASTVAMITTAGMMAPLMETMGFTSPLARVLVVMAIGAGSMVASHANDSYFWVVSQFSDMKTEQAYRCQTGMTAVMGITLIIIIYIVSLFVV